MKLSELKTINEGRVPITLEMVIREVVKDGKITNEVQAITLATIIAYLQIANDILDWSAIDEYRDAALRGDLVKYVKAIPPEEQVKIATELLIVISCHNKVQAVSSAPNLMTFMNTTLQAQR